MNVLGDQERDPRERGVNDVYPGIRELLTNARAAPDTETSRRDHEVDRELGPQCEHQQTCAGVLRADAREGEDCDRAEREPGVAELVDDPTRTAVAGDDFHGGADYERQRNGGRTSASGTANSSGTNASWVGTV